ncbi:CmpA/NrtA family ABC transporter substrate-binding protein [Comamonadaceae bacterium G21597-S1]|nr:CmpA/NrtA family ABC transporter substrate-binding protein [Comamonadaceae bacterium G21597-S1]
MSDPDRANAPTPTPQHAPTPVSRGSDAPERDTVHVGTMALTDCASIVMAHELGLDRKYGVTIVPHRESSWANVRDKLVHGSLDMAQALYGMVYGIHLGVGTSAVDMAVLMTLNRNGQGLSLARPLAEKGATDLASLCTLMRREPRVYTFAQTFPTGTHAMWLNYWLASGGIDPLTEIRSIVVPPAQMVGYVRKGSIDGFSAGEPWNHVGIMEGVSVHAAASQDVWPDHPEKVLATRGDFARRYPNTARAVIMAVLEASRWIDANAGNRMRMAATIAGSAYVNVPVDVIRERILGRYQDGLGRQWQDTHPMRFFDDGQVNFPYLSDGMWFLTQFKRWGLLRAHPDYQATARAINQTALYRQAASQLGVSAPEGDMRTSRLIDGVVWDGTNPARYADGFAVQARPRHATEPVTA